MCDRNVIGHDMNGDPIYTGSLVRMAVRRPDGNYKKVWSLTGVVLGEHQMLSGVLYISWNGLTTGHNCDGLLTNKSGWNLSTYEIVVVPDPVPEQEPDAPPDLTGAFWL